MSERLQPEELTDLLNEYFTEMSAIAEAHGATVDKFIDVDMLTDGDAQRLKGTLQNAMAALSRKAGPEPQAE